MGRLDRFPQQLVQGCDQRTDKEALSLTSRS